MVKNIPSGQNSKEEKFFGSKTVVAGRRDPCFQKNVAQNLWRE